MNALELKIPPPLQVIITATAMYGVSKTLPMLKFSVTGSKWLSVGLGITGLSVAAMGVTQFKKAQTTVNPKTLENATHLVTSGIYQYTRNPMYVGLVLILLAWALYLSHLLTLVLLAVFISYITRFQILPEERVMKQKFGDKYRAYLARVRRWV
ncbi:isoprenylcysteine carboxylmethyltransferase family protein [Psychrobacter sp. GP33]|uniref:methyltransferase family protein n=1 Tax=Psychrobacter sp. GP33 TaxID=2758709 RepID=UPI0015FD95B1|nr:isoprenylcysteine carboxylmethyltransferase family protein [Psychrobacter sp. GP33]